MLYINISNHNIYKCKGNILSVLYSDMLYINTSNRNIHKWKVTV